MANPVVESELGSTPEFAPEKKRAPARIRARFVPESAPDFVYRKLQLLQGSAPPGMGPKGSHVT